MQDQAVPPMNYDVSMSSVFSHGRPSPAQAIAHTSPRLLCRLSRTPDATHVNGSIQDSFGYGDNLTPNASTVIAGVVADAGVVPPVQLAQYWQRSVGAIEQCLDTRLQTPSHQPNKVPIMASRQAGQPQWQSQAGLSTGHNLSATRATWTALASHTPGGAFSAAFSTSYPVCSSNASGMANPALDHHQAPFGMYSSSWWSNVASTCSGEPSPEHCSTLISSLPNGQSGYVGQVRNMGQPILKKQRISSPRTIEPQWQYSQHQPSECRCPPPIAPTQATLKPVKETWGNKGKGLGHWEIGKARDLKADEYICQVCGSFREAVIYRMQDAIMTMFGRLDRASYSAWINSKVMRFSSEFEGSSGQKLVIRMVDLELLCGLYVVDGEQFVWKYATTGVLGRQYRDYRLVYEVKDVTTKGSVKEAWEQFRKDLETSTACKAAVASTNNQQQTSPSTAQLQGPHVAQECEQHSVQKGELPSATLARTIVRNVWLSQGQGQQRWMLKANSQGPEQRTQRYRK